MAVAIDVIRELLSGGRKSHPILSMDGALSPNNRLEALERLDIVLNAPCDLCDGHDDSLIVAADRQLVRVNLNHQEPAQVIATFGAPISALTHLQDGSFVVGVNGIGLFHTTQAGEIIARLETAAGMPLRCVTAIVEDPRRQGVYFTVGTTRHDAEDWIWDLMECNADGFMGRWALDTTEPDILLDKLAYPSGLLIEDDDTLLLPESWNHTITRYQLDGTAVTRPERVVGNMPGYPGQLAKAGNGGYWLAVFALRTQLIELVLREKAFKRDMMRSLEPDYWIRPALSSSGSHLEPLQMGAMKKLGIRKPWAPPRSYGLVVRLDHEGEVTDSLHSRVDGHNHGITAAREIGNRLFIVSKGNDRILIQPNRETEHE